MGNARLSFASSLGLDPRFLHLFVLSNVLTERCCHVERAAKHKHVNIWFVL